MPGSGVADAIQIEQCLDPAVLAASSAPAGVTCRESALRCSFAARNRALIARGMSESAAA